MIVNYFTDRKQKVMLGDCKCDWHLIFKNAPHHTICCFYVYFFQMICYTYNLSDFTVFNYNTTTIACTNVNYGRAHSEIWLAWFEKIILNANPANFQFICSEERTLAVQLS